MIKGLYIHLYIYIIGILQGTFFVILFFVLCRTVLQVLRVSHLRPHGCTLGAGTLHLCTMSYGTT